MIGQKARHAAVAVGKGVNDNHAMMRFSRGKNRLPLFCDWSLDAAQASQFIIQPPRIFFHGRRHRGWLRMRHIGDAEIFFTVSVIILPGNNQERNRVMYADIDHVPEHLTGI